MKTSAQVIRSQYDFELATGTPKNLIEELATLRFAECGESAVFLGPSGVSKSHLAIALGYWLPRRASRPTSPPLPA